MKQFSDETQKIINAHRNDFNCTNYNIKIKEHGGYTNYVKSLGGVFTKYIGKTTNVKTVEELNEIGEYVFGLMSIFGFDYNNGSKYVNWGGGCPFYINNNKGKCNWGRIDDLCNGTKDRTTNCNYGIDSLLYKAGLMGNKNQVKYSSSFKGQVNTYKCKIIRNKTDLRPGDLVHMFSFKITSNDPSTWKGWGHVTCVAEVTSSQIILFDAGSRFIRSGNYKYAINKSGSDLGGAYNNYDGWVGIRICNLLDSNKADSDLAIEVLHGYFGSGETRKKNLGTRYNAVQVLVNEYLGTGGRENYIRAAALYVLKGYAGKDQVRKDFFRNDYDEVQTKVNWTITTAKEVIKGRYGNGDVRKAALGEDYDLVQAEVNILLK